MIETLRLLSTLVALSAIMACVGAGGEEQRRPAENGSGTGRITERDRMVDTQIRARGVADERVLAAMRHVPRHRFVPGEHQARAYDDTPLPIGFDQTISQPYIVAYMSEVLDTRSTDRVLEIGTGSGYQAAVLGDLVREVYTIEIVEPLATRARETMAALGYTNINVRHGNGYLGWPEAAPFDRIIVTAAPDDLPKALVDQLATGGVMVVPVGRGEQIMTIVRKTERGVTTTETLPVRFVPMVGKEK
jgi:protein-L-isoaspartate(D-aspartate) O-methyltransferase